MDSGGVQLGAMGASARRGRGSESSSAARAPPPPPSSSGAKKGKVSQPRGGKAARQRDQAHRNMRADVERRRARREVKAIVLTVLYLIGITVLCINGFSSSLLFYTAHNAANALSHADPPADDWEQLETVADVLNFWKETFLPAVLAEDVNNIALHRPPRTVLGVNYIVGPIRYGVVRVNEERCPSAPAFVEGTSFRCWPSFSAGSENKSTHAGIPFRRDESEPWDWTTLGVEYPPPGIFQLIDPSMNLSTGLALMDSLEQRDLIDLSTRAIFMDVVMFNANFNHLVLVRLIGEMLPSGGVIPHTTQHLLEPTLFHSEADWIQMCFQLLVLVQTIYFLGVECFRIYSGCRDVDLRTRRRRPCKYFRSFTNVLSLISYLFILLSAGYRFAEFMALPDRNTLDINSAEFVHMWLPDRLQQTAVRLFSVGAYLIWIKLLAYLSIAPQFALLTRTLQRAWESIYSFLFMLFIVFFATSLSHLVVFSTQLIGYRNMEQSMYTMMLSLLGEVDFHDMYQVAPIVGPFLFIFFVFLAVIIMLNVFVGIITTAYETAEEELQNEPERPIVREIYLYVMSILERIPLVGRCVQSRKKLLKDIKRKARVVDMRRRRKTRVAQRRSVPDAVAQENMAAGALVPSVRQDSPPSSNPPHGHAPAVTEYASSSDE